MNVSVINVRVDDAHEYEWVLIKRVLIVNQQCRRNVNMNEHIWICVSWTLNKLFQTNVC